MTTLCGLLNHLSGLLVPVPSWLVIARSTPLLLLLQDKLFGVVIYFSGIRDTYIRICILCPTNVVEHRHEYNSSLKLIWINWSNFQTFLNMSENLNQCEPWENIPLEFNWFSINSRQFCTLVLLLEIMNLFFPLDVCFRKLIYSSQTQYWIRMDMYLCFSPFDRLIMAQSHCHPRREVIHHGS